MTTTKTTIGKGNSLLYSLFVGAFLVWQSIDVSYGKEGFEAKTKDVPLPTIVACSTFIAVGLGINILDTLQALKELATRNAIAIKEIKENLPATTDSNSDQPPE